MPVTRKRRTRTKSPTTSEIVAPGGGTQNDVDKLAKNLGLPNDAVSAILNCEGNGIAAPNSRTSRSSASTSGNGSGIGSGNGNGNPVVSSAWADFINDEGFSSSSVATKTAAATADDHDDGNANKRLKSDDTAASGAADDTSKKEKASSSTSTSAATTTITAATTTESTVREYDLPIRRHKPTPGILAQTGTLDSAIVGRNKRPLVGVEDLQEPTILAFESIFNKKKIAFIAASSTSSHSIAITTDGEAYAWGRNEAGQCGNGSTSSCVPMPTKIALTGTFVAAAVGKNHSILVEQGGDVYAVGGNKYGQCGVNTKVEAILSWRKCVFEKQNGDDVEIVQASCGESFTVLLSSEGYIYSAGLSEFGQLGNGETGEYFVSASKIAFANATKFERRSIFVHSPADSEQTNLDEAKKATIPLSDSDDIRIGSISCGKNHTVAVEAQTKNKTHSARVFTWGCGSYGVLGHSVQKDEYTPRFVGVFQGPLFKTNSPVRAAAGAHCSMILTENGHVYYSGKHRSVGEATMRPTLIDVLANNMHVVTSLGGGAQSVFCSTSNGVTVSWGMGLTGELGFGKESAKSSSKPKFVEKLDKCLVTDVACGYGHTLFLIRDEDAEDKAELKKISKIEVSDLSAFVEKVTK